MRILYTSVYETRLSQTINGRGKDNVSLHVALLVSLDNGNIDRAMNLRQWKSFDLIRVHVIVYFFSGLFASRVDGEDAWGSARVRT